MAYVNIQFVQLDGLEIVHGKVEDNIQGDRVEMRRYH